MLPAPAVLAVAGVLRLAGKAFLFLAQVVDADPARLFVALLALEHQKRISVFINRPCHGSHLMRLRESY